MAKKLTYKKYTGSVEYSEEDGMFFGKLLYITDLVLYDAETEEQLQESFESAVDEYLEDCKGTFNVRVTPEVHLELKFMAIRNNKSLNEIVSQACIAAIQADKAKKSYEFTPGKSSWKRDGYPGVGAC